MRNRTTGVLYVLDEPSIGLHPSNIDGLLEVMHDLLADGNSVVMVDHDTHILRHADYLVEMGPGAGASGGQVIAQGSLGEVESNPATRIGPFLLKNRITARSHSPRCSNYFQPRAHPSRNEPTTHRQATAGRHPPRQPNRRYGRFWLR